MSSGAGARAGAGAGSGKKNLEPEPPQNRPAPKPCPQHCIIVVAKNDTFLYICRSHRNYICSKKCILYCLRLCYRNLMAL